MIPIVTRRALPILPMLLALACGSDEPSGSVPDDAEDADLGRPLYVAAEHAGAIRGTVRWEGDVPARRPIDVTGDEFCESCYGEGEQLLSETVIVDAGGGLANALVRIDDESLRRFRFARGTATREIDQKACRYVPHVIGLLRGDVLRVRNSDATLHNIHAISNRTGEDWFNHAQNARDEPYERKTEVTGLYRLKCDVHNWMVSYVWVVKHPLFAVSAADGSFRIANVPPGEYTLVAWHEKEGEKRIEVTVAGGEEAAADFAFGRAG